MSEHGELDDGFGSIWPLCKQDCQMQIVRPGKVQCDCDYALKIGDKVRHIHRFREHTPGTVIQIEGGSDGQLTEVYWPDNGDALWHTTSHLQAESAEVSDV